MSSVCPAGPVKHWSNTGQTLVKHNRASSPCPASAQPAPDATSADVTNKDVTSADVTNKDATSADVTNKDVTSADVTNKVVTSADVTNKDVTSRDSEATLLSPGPGRGEVGDHAMVWQAGKFDRARDVLTMLVNLTIMVMFGRVGEV